MKLLKISNDKSVSLLSIMPETPNVPKNLEPSQPGSLDRYSRVNYPKARHLNFFEYPTTSLTILLNMVHAFCWYRWHL